MPSRPRIYWQELESANRPTWWAPGWLPDTDTLRWSLANSLKVEADYTWQDAYAQADAITVYESYVAEDENGDWVEVSPAGVDEVSGNIYRVFQPATLVLLGTVDV